MIKPVIYLIIVVLVVAFLGFGVSNLRQMWVNYETRLRNEGQLACAASVNDATMAAQKADTEALLKKNAELTQLAEELNQKNVELSNASSSTQQRLEEMSGKLSGCTIPDSIVEELNSPIGKLKGEKSKYLKAK